MKLARESFQVWMSFLGRVQTNKENVHRAMGYFFEEFQAEPKAFYEFLPYLRRHLARQPDSPLTKKVAKGYLAIISPLAERFGFYEEKSQLDTLCFKVSNPRGYAKVEKLIAEYKKTADKVIKTTLQSLKELMKAAGYNCTIQGRFKNEYSIYKKLEKKRSSRSMQLFDMFAFRIVIANGTPEQCTDVMNVLHDTYLPVATRFKDYISIPKINGYQSIHTCLNDMHPGQDIPIEVQIRTDNMNEFAERGVAAHWQYATTKKTTLPSIMKHEFVPPLSSSTTESSEPNVYFFSKTGDLFSLPSGSTALDFAFQVHTHVGSRASGARVNRKKQPIDYALQTGDTVEILTEKASQVRPEWVEYARNPSTIKKIYECL